MKIAVIGIACTKFGELWNKSLQDLLAESEINALHDAKISPKQIDGIYTGNMCSATTSGQSHLGAMASQILNLNCPSSTVEGACASGGLALRAGILALESGSAQVVMVNGVEKMTDLTSSEITTALMSAGSEESEHFIGATFAGLNALIARAYIHKYNLTRKQLAKISVENHKNGFSNPLAHLQKRIKLEDVINSQMVADPLTIFDCAPISDGASSVILCSEDFLNKHLKNNKDLKPIFIIGSGQACDTLEIAKRDNLTEFKATQIAAKKAYKQARISPKEIDIAEIHNAFSILEVISLEDLGFAEKGKGVYFFEENPNKLINVSGGLKSKGHPVGATGVSQCYEVVKNLRSNKKLNFGLSHNLGGCGSTTVVHIYSKN